MKPAAPYVLYIPTAVQHKAMRCVRLEHLPYIIMGKEGAWCLCFEMLVAPIMKNGSRNSVRNFDLSAVIPSAFVCNVAQQQ